MNRAEPSLKKFRLDSLKFFQIRVKLSSTHVELELNICKFKFNSFKK